MTGIDQLDHLRMLLPVTTPRLTSHNRLALEALRNGADPLDELELRLEEARSENARATALGWGMHCQQWGDQMIRIFEPLIQAMRIYEAEKQATD